MKKLTTMSALLIATLALSGITVSAAEDKTIDSNMKIEFKANGSGETIPPVDPMDPNPEEPVVPENPNPGLPTSGPLSLDYASFLTFGEKGSNQIEISSKTQKYYANPQTFTNGTPDGPNYVQLSDLRGTGAGWTLQVKQNEQFKASDGETLLDGAQLTFKNAEVATIASSAKPSTVTPGFTLTFAGNGAGVAEKVVVANSAGKEGMGTYVYRFGTDATKEESIELEVPGKTNKLADAYTASLTWTLSDVPS